MNVAHWHPLYYPAVTEKWKEKCRKLQMQFCNGYGAAEFHCFEWAEDRNRNLLRERICLALFGAPKDGDNVTQFAQYSSEQLAEASQFVTRICSQYREKTHATVELITIFVCCKSFVGESIVPVFRIRLDQGVNIYMDTSKNVYYSWEEWLRKNNLPVMKCYPRSGYYPYPQEESNTEWIEFGNLPTSLIALTRRAVNELSKTFLFFNGSEMHVDTARTFDHAEYILKYKFAMEKKHLKTNRTGKPSSAFDLFLRQNQGIGSIDDLSKKVNFLKTIENPAYLFNGLTNARSIVIDNGREQTLRICIKGTESMTTSVSVNKSLFVPFVPKTPLRYEMSVALKEHKAFAKNNLKFNEMKPHEGEQLKNALFTTCLNRSYLIGAAVSVSTELNVDNISDFCAVSELVRFFTSECETEDEQKEKIKCLMDTGKKDFIRDIKADVEHVSRIVKDEEPAIVFESNLKAVYHFRKHRGEFGNCSIEIYLVQLPREFFVAENLQNVDIGKDTITETYYCTRPSLPNEEKKYCFGKLLKQRGRTQPVMTTIHDDKGGYGQKCNDERKSTFKKSNAKYLF